MDVFKYMIVDEKYQERVDILQSREISHLLERQRVSKYILYTTYRSHVCIAVQTWQYSHRAISWLEKHWDLFTHCPKYFLYLSIKLRACQG